MSIVAAVVRAAAGCAAGAFGRVAEAQASKLAQSAARGDVAASARAASCLDLMRECQVFLGSYARAQEI